MGEGDQMHWHLISLTHKAKQFLEELSSEEKIIYWLYMILEDK